LENKDEDDEEEEKKEVVMVVRKNSVLKEDYEWQWFFKKSYNSSLSLNPFS
jgi:hypothetical protein